MRYKGRVDRLSKAIDEVAGTGDEYRYVFKEPDESEEQCLARYGLSRDPPGLTIFIIKWASGDEHQYPGNQEKTAAKPDISAIDKEIQQLKTELLEDGLSELEIIDKMTEPEPSPKDIKEDNLLKPVPLKADSLTRLNKR